MPAPDIAVVGAGPAGAWAAYRLARAGARVVIFDGSHPREKPCGGGVTARALALVADAVAPGTVASVAIERAVFVDPQGGRAEVDTTRTPLIVASRTAFDGALLAAAVGAGANLATSRVANVSRDGAGFVVTTSAGTAVHAPFIVGADGANSLVRRRLSQPFARADLSIAAGFFVRGTSSREITIELVDDPPGYIWSFPRPDHLAVGICAQADGPASSAALRERVRGWIHRANVAPGAALQPYAWPIPSLQRFSGLAPHTAGPRWMLVGDAAGLVDPLTREGIFFALQSAEFAAAAIIGGRGGPGYLEGIGDELLPELERAARFKAGFFRRRFIALLVEALQSSAGLQRVMADLIAGEQGYRTLKWRLLATLEWGLALRALR